MNEVKEQCRFGLYSHSHSFPVFQDLRRSKNLLKLILTCSLTSSDIVVKSIIAFDDFSLLDYDWTCIYTLMRKLQMLTVKELELHVASVMLCLLFICHDLLP